MPAEPSEWKYQFASDHVAAVCPEAWQALARANGPAFAPSYGDDEFTQQAIRLVRDVFETDGEVFFVSSGTAANALALAAVCRSYDGVVCHPLAHVEHDEANAVEAFTGGAKLLHVGGAAGKIDPAGLPAVFERGHGIHSARPRAVSLTQATEVGTVYTADEVRTIAALKHDRPGFRVHMDGARLANALAALPGVTPADLTWRAGVDVLSLGGSKNGGPPGEAVVFFDRGLAEEFAWRQKQAGQVVSKARYLSAAWLGLLADDVWLKNARHANGCARRLADGLQARGIALRFPVETNAVFACLSDQAADGLRQRGWHFYPFSSVDAWRFMCSWATRPEAVAALLTDLDDLL